MATAPSQVRQNYHRECEAAINEQINVKLYTSYVYLSMAYHYDREDVNLKNFAGYFLHHSHKRREQGEILLKLQNQHGGRTQLQDIRKPDLNDWGNGLNQDAPLPEMSMAEYLLDKLILGGSYKEK
ncbi:ferritin heavy chain-like [Orycteropus afer afer]|uniref:Ferritin heavy chain-like n=1 Tax=Orycteropus afer afer TaxID=1230840 RepID=A0AC54ZBS6_ORYAF|nr:ferritin heavy chain-like [Orycteropus afer afer]